MKNVKTVFWSQLQTNFPETETILNISNITMQIG